MADADVKCMKMQLTEEEEEEEEPVKKEGNASLGKFIEKRQ